jgi:asparagine synthase (glutamine-hydrolysing)
MSAQLQRSTTTTLTLIRSNGLGLAFPGGGNANCHHSPGQLTALIIGRPRLTDPALATRATTQGFARVLAESWRARGRAVLEALAGRFLVVLIDETRRTALLATDRAGIERLYYTELRGGVVFGSSADVVMAHPAVQAEIDPQAIYDYLYFHVIPAPRSIYRGVRKLDPAQFVELQAGRVITGNWWNLHYERESERLDVGALKEEFRALLAESVRREDAGGEVGAFLSGGTDSSTIAGHLALARGTPARTYSIGFDAAGFDEMEYARLASRHFSTQHREYYVTPADVARAIPLIAAGYGEPFGNSSAAPAYFCADLARGDGISRMLAGDGGDELFGGNLRYATQHLFSHYDRLPAVLRRGLIEPLVCGVPGIRHIPGIKKIRSYVEQARMPMPARMESYNLLERLGRQNVLTHGFLTCINHAEPLRLLAGVYNGAHAKTMLNRMLALDYKFTLADNDLPKVVGSAALAGMEVAFPLLSDEMVAFAARLPVALKLRGTRLRYFFKEALRDFLPDEIITKSKHGFGLPYGPWLIQDARLHELAADSFATLRNRGIIKPAFLDSLLHQRLREHPGFYGNMIWVLVMLEQWFEAHAVNYRGADHP